MYPQCEIYQRNIINCCLNYILNSPTSQYQKKKTDRHQKRGTLHLSAAYSSSLNPFFITYVRPFISKTVGFLTPAFSASEIWGHHEMTTYLCGHIPIFHRLSQKHCHYNSSSIYTFVPIIGTKMVQDWYKNFTSLAALNPSSFSCMRMLLGICGSFYIVLFSYSNIYDVTRSTLPSFIIS